MGSAAAQAVRCSNTAIFVSRGGSLLHQLNPAARQYFCEGHTGTSSFYNFDTIGSTTEVTDANGILLNEYTYDPFGISLGGSETTDNPFRYIGNVGVTADQDGLLFMRSREFSSQLGRFVQQDSVGAIGGLNLYRYCENDPLNLVDPSGVRGKWYDPIGWPHHGKWYGKYMSRGRAISIEEIELKDLNVNPVDNEDRAARLHDL